MELRSKCKVCGHRWIRREEKLPLRCPKPFCQSPYWDKEKDIKDE